MIRIIHEENMQNLEKSINDFMDKQPCGELVGLQSSMFNDDFYAMIFTPSDYCPKRGRRDSQSGLCRSCCYNHANK